MSEEDESYRARLHAQTMRWRLALGVGSWGMAIAMIALSALLLSGESQLVRVDGPRLIVYAIPFILSLLVAGWVLLRVGEIDLATGRLVRAAPVPWPRIVGLVIVVAIASALVIAWPLGVYTAIRASRTACGQLVPIDVLRAQTTLPLSYAQVSEEDGCDVTISGRGRAYAVALVRQRAVPDDHEWRSQLNRYHPDRREVLDVPADTALLLVNDDVLVIALRRGTVGSFVQLRRDTFDVDDALAIARTIE